MTVRTCEKLLCVFCSEFGKIGALVFRLRLTIIHVLHWGGWI